jgi:hypothetical protein
MPHAAGASPSGTGACTGTSIGDSGRLLWPESSPAWSLAGGVILYWVPGQELTLASSEGARGEALHQFLYGLDLGAILRASGPIRGHGPRILCLIMLGSASRMRRQGSGGREQDQMNYEEQLMVSGVI